MLTLSEAIKTRKIQEFIAQEEARGVAPVDLKEFQDLAARLVKGNIPLRRSGEQRDLLDLAQAPDRRQRIGLRGLAAAQNAVGDQGRAK